MTTASSPPHAATSIPPRAAVPIMNGYFCRRPWGIEKMGPARAGRRGLGWEFGVNFGVKGAKHDLLYRGANHDIAMPGNQHDRRFTDPGRERRAELGVADQHVGRRAPGLAD